MIKFNCVHVDFVDLASVKRRLLNVDLDRTGGACYFEV